MKNKRHALITGGAGFLGTHLAEQLLQSGYTVSLLDRNSTKKDLDVRQISGDIRDQHAVDKAMKGIDIVFHLAGILGTSELNERSIEAVEINVIGTLHILEAAKRHKTKVVFISKPNLWLNTYTITKSTAEQFCVLFYKEFDVPILILRWFNAYGPGQKVTGVQKAVPTFITKALRNEPIPIYGDGLQVADFIFATDVAIATRIASENSIFDGHIVDIGTGEGVTPNDLAEQILQIVGSKSRLQHHPMRSGEEMNSRAVADVSTIFGYGFRPEVSLRKGLEITIDFYRNQKKEIL